ncbi:hypothetical protein OB905_11870 [Halobacteria archaeon AArc-dxtr1]|nr:hypothetical protein [Halobacteria archaeon AArc-dxtr1]
MSASTDPDRRKPISFDPPAVGLAALPTRLALATRSMSGRSWAVLFVVVPVGLLGASLWITPRVANGLVGLSGFLALTLWATGYYNYGRARVRINPSRGTLIAVLGNADGLERTVDLGRVESVSVERGGAVALLRVDDHSFAWIERVVIPDPVAISERQLPSARDALQVAGVSVSDPNPVAGRRSRSATVRLVVTPLVLVGVPLAALVAFGRSVLLTNGAVIVLVLAVGAIGWELRAR